MDDTLDAAAIPLDSVEIHGMFAAVKESLFAPRRPLRTPKRPS